MQPRNTSLSAGISPADPASPDAITLSCADRLGFASLVCCVGLTQSSLIAFLPILSSKTGLSVLSLGIVTSCGMLAMLGGAPLAGWLSDRAGRRKTLMACLAIFCVAQLFLAAIVSAAMNGTLSPSLCLSLLMICRLLHGIATGGLLPVAQAWVADLTGIQGRMAGLAAISAGFSAGRLAGPLLVSVTLPLGATMPLWVMALLPMPLGSILLRRPPPESRHRNIRPRSGAACWRNPAILRLLILAAIVNIAFGTLHFVLGPLFQQRLGWTAQMAGIRLGWITALMAALMLANQMSIIPRLTTWPRHTLAVGIAVIWLSALCLTCGQSAWSLGAGVCLLGQGLALSGPACTALVSIAAGGRQGAASGLLSSVLTLGYAAGATLGGFLFTLGDTWPAMTALVILPLILPFFPLRESWTKLSDERQIASDA
ncbi:MFS transporter [Granulibacter bethesdensis]|uniref:MFS transporter n=1 Tax=Granulibacter bethesdensis TaxID=364410 RepID=UPI0003F1D4A8|nr:MFS transporter [Granulibacter bethesdensis]AHJ69586.1 Transporter, MFS superfamily [Granulibacter bethesdensis]